MIIKSYAKINLSLTINKKIKKKGLHDIQSQFCLINLFDTISIKKNKNNFDKISFNGPHSKKVKKKNNSCLLYTSPSPRDVRSSRMPSSA